MIYLVSDNYFLFNGIAKVIQPQKTEWIRTKALHADLLKSLGMRDLVLVDTGSCSNDIADLLPNVINNPGIVFMTRIKNEDVNYNLKRYFPFSLSLDVPLEEFHFYVLKKQAGDVPVKNIRKILTEREFYILRDSLRGLKTKTIARSNGIHIKTVYTHVKSACHKLGINKITDALPFIVWFINRQENSGGDALTGQRVQAPPAAPALAPQM